MINYEIKIEVDPLTFVIHSWAKFQVQSGATDLWISLLMNKSPIFLISNVHLQYLRNAFHIIGFELYAEYVITQGTLSIMFNIYVLVLKNNYTDRHGMSAKSLLNLIINETFLVMNIYTSTII